MTETPDQLLPGELAPTENHPAAHEAFHFIKTLDPNDLMMWRENFASMALAGNRTAEVCHHTLERIMEGKGVGERYVLGLAWVIKKGTPTKLKFEIMDLRKSLAWALELIKRRCQPTLTEQKGIEAAEIILHGDR